ncbi:cobalamin biosynthesis protein [Roseospirillum parvum]|uniref:Cobalt-precorrin 5A hydrolase / precorrin-3B C17-methyltransferase n=1 Tax=Roseospirillum parvum TaxID=83401 RepID=A0A1G7WUY8_9PROT|nr:cobalamin biosynthesis protein [Roseospirillum parvum]SDG75674.1 cobalt-precorrin 5A hydrolase / precorrin-3B C17-methyltransferase [Roseospirillum parvum]
MSHAALPFLALGVGCRQRADAEAAFAFIGPALAERGLDPARLGALGSLDRRRDNPTLSRLAEHLGLPLRVFPAAELEALTPRLLTPSAAVFRAVGCHGVAEAAALACLGTPPGPAARLIVPKLAGPGITLAVAAGPLESPA